ncbi:hypothetical protein [Streptomyces sp. NPDC050504]|uniref:hypothetical protein n=1 Tax=Streptomyces sp. NPDC050504 TaxID=3365618 RepID=UPI0037AF466E
MRHTPDPVPGRTSDPGPVSGRTSDPGPVSGRTSDPGPVSGRTSDPGSVSGRTSDPGPVSGRTSDPGSVSGRTSDPGPVPGRTSDPGPVPVPGHAPGSAPGRTSGPAPGAVPPGPAHTGAEASAYPDGERARLGERLQHAVSHFVDSPRRAVEEADGVLEETVRRLTEHLAERRRTLRTAWEGGADRGAADTEELRVALRSYRETAERLLRL